MATTRHPTERLAAHDAVLDGRPVAFADIPRTTWDRLLSRTHSPTPFSRWTFHRAWWDAYGDTAHEQYLVCLPAGHAGAIDWSVARAIVPLMHRHEIEPDDAECRTSVRPHEPTGTRVAGEAKAVFFGGELPRRLRERSGRSGRLARCRHLDGARPRAAARSGARTDRMGRGRPAPPAPDRSGFGGARIGTVGTIGLARGARARGRVPGGYITVGDWEEFLATLDKKARHEIRRKIRRAQAIGPLTVEIASPTTSAIDAFIALHRMRFGDDGLFPNNPGGERSRKFVHRLAELERNESGGGQLHVALVRCGTRLIFAALAFDDGGTVFLYNAGMDPSAREASPGVSGTALYFQDRLAAGRRRFDYLRGNESYKYEWGAVDEAIERLLVTRA